MGNVPKIAVIGAGNVGATLAMRIAESGLAEVVLLDVYKSLAQGKALDIFDSSGMNHSLRPIQGTDDFSSISGSSIVVITAGLARTPGMAREELALKNAVIVKAISSEIRLRAPDSVIIVVTNPLDTMTYLAYKTSAFPRAKVLGMAGVLDESRFKALIASELNVETNDIETVIMGGHGDTMVPVLSHTRVKKALLMELLPEKKIDELIIRIRGRGAEIVSLLGSGSAYYSPSLAAFRMAEAIVYDRKEVITASVFLNGEYGLRDICAGVPVKLGRSGIEEIVEIKLTDRERSLFMESARVIRQGNAKL